MTFPKSAHKATFQLSECEPNAQSVTGAETDDSEFLDEKRRVVNFFVGFVKQRKENVEHASEILQHLRLVSHLDVLHGSLSEQPMW